VQATLTSPKTLLARPNRLTDDISPLPLRLSVTPGIAWPQQGTVIRVGSKMKVHRRKFLHIAAATTVALPALPALPRIASAEAYPARPVRIVVGFPPGAATDIIARLVAEGLSQRLGQQFIVDNRPGAGSNIGAETAIKAPPDGYTLLAMTVTNAVNATLYDNLNFDFLRDIAPISGTIRSASVLEVNPGVPVKSVPEFIAYAKANPGKLNYASFGNGTAPNMAAELFKMMTGVNLVHVPYKSSYMPDLLSGQVQLTLHADPADDLVYPLGPDAGAGGHQRDVVRRAAGHSAHCRIRAGLRGQYLARHRRAEEYAAGHRRHAQQSDQRRHHRSGHEGKVRQSGRRADADDACRMPKIHYRADRQVGQGGEIRRHETGIATRQADCSAPSSRVTSLTNSQVRSTNGGGDALVLLANCSRDFSVTQSVRGLRAAG
jgi:hypothetical protein